MIMKKNWKNRSGVSPVIATILMVAITVVLAAVLYVMVMGFGGTNSSAPTGTFTMAEKQSADTMKFTFGTMSKETKFTDCKVVIEHAGSTTTAVALTESGNVTGITGFNLKVTDLAGDKKISTGDYLTISPSSGVLSGEYTVNLLYNDGSQICTKTLSI